MILVTGGTGFIGFNLVKALKRKGENVIILARKESNLSLFKGLDVKIITGDLNDIGSLKKATTGIDIVYNAAGMLGGPKVTYEQLYAVNVNGTSNLLKACKQNNVKRFIHISSVAAMGNIEQMATENSACKPLSDYDNAKYLSEKVVINSGIPWTIIRPSMVYGPGEKTNKSRMFRLIQKGYFKIIGDGNNLLSTIYIENLITGITLLAKKDEAINEIYILTDGKNYTQNEFVNAIADKLHVYRPMHIPFIAAYMAAFGFKLLSLIGIPQLLTKDRIKTLIGNHSFNIEKAKKMGYNPKISLEDGIERTINWYRQEGILK